ncbi:MAG: NDP-sugar synthase [Chloroflexi bacterium]|nr:NDP-sugar synthase [Chloroflexota bacterium]
MPSTIMLRCNHCEILQPHQPADQGVAVTDSSGWITAFLEKPAREDLPSNLAAAGIYIFGRRALDRLPADAPCDIGLHAMPHLLHCDLRIRGVIAGPEVYVRDIGTPESLEAAGQDVSRG